MKQQTNPPEIRESRFNVSIDYLKTALEVYKGAVNHIAEKNWAEAYYLIRCLHIQLFSRMVDKTKCLELKEECRKMYNTLAEARTNFQTELRYQDKLFDWLQEIMIQADYAGLFMEDKPTEWDAIGK